MNNDYKNYYKKRLIESIIYEVSNPGEASTAEQPVADIRGFLKKLLQRTRPAPAPVVITPKVPGWIQRYAKKHRYIIRIDGSIRWGRIRTQNGNIYEVVYDPERNGWFFRAPDGTIYPMHKDFRPPPGFGDGGGGQEIPFHGILPALLNPGTEEPEEISPLPPFGPEHPYDPYYNPAGEDVNDPDL